MAAQENKVTPSKIEHHCCEDCKFYFITGSGSSACERARTFTKFYERACVLFISKVEEHAPSMKPEEILYQMFANGQISFKQYLRFTEELKKGI